jgi:chromate transport protein ChrA
VAVLCYRHRKVLAGFIAGSIPILVSCWAMIGVSGIREYISMTRVTDAREAPSILCCLRGLVDVMSGGNHPGVCIGLSLALVVFTASLKVSRVPLFCIGVLVTMLVSWHCHLYDAVLLLVPMAWMLESEVRWARWSVILLLVVTPVLLFMPFEAYLLAAVVLVGLGLLLMPKMKQQMLQAEVGNQAAV